MSKVTDSDLNNFLLKGIRCTKCLCFFTNLRSSCFIGHFCESHYSAPEDCPPGTYMPYGIDTNTGDYVGPGEPAKRRFDCIDCPGGYWCGAATVNPTECTKGLYSPPGQFECTVCEMGHYCNSTITSEEMMYNDLRCPAGYFCPEGLSDVADAEDCSVAKYCPEGNVACLITIYITREVIFSHVCVFV